MEHHFGRDGYLVLNTGKIVLVLFLVVILQLNCNVELGYCSSGSGFSSGSVAIDLCSEKNCVNSSSDPTSSPTCSTQCDDNDTDPRHRLYLVAMGPFPDPISKLNPDFSGGPSVIAAVELALEQINRNDGILPDYKLCMIEADSGCDVVSKLSISIVRDVYDPERQVVGIIGPACSGAALLLAPLNARQNVSIINITPSAISPLLDNPKHHNTFATVSTSLLYIESFRALIEVQKWENVAALYDEERVFFKSTFDKFREEIGTKIRFSSAVYDNDNNNDTRSFPLDQLKESQSRVVFTFVGSVTASRLLCFAFRNNMIHPTYQWIFHERTLAQVTSPTVFIVDGTEYNCTEDDMLIAVNGVILNQYDLEQKGTIDVTGQSYNEYFKEYECAFNNYLFCANKARSDKYNITIWANPYYDATWAMAQALHKASENGVNLSRYTYGQLEETDIIRQQLFKLNFNGSSGPIFFNEGSRSTNTVIGITQLWVYNGNIQSNHLGNFSLNILHLSSNATENFIDSDIFNLKEIRINIGVSILTMMISIVLFVVSALLQVAFLRWHDYKSIKATSPNISHLIFSGCYLFSISVFVFTIQETFDYPTQVHPTLYALFCNIITWCMILGYSLIFGTVLAKAWRIYRLFKHFRSDSPGILLTDNALCLFVIVLLVVDTCVLVTWNVLDPWLHETNEEKIINVTNIPTILFRSQCNCRQLFVWVGVVVGYKGFIAIGLLLFSILNRKIRRRGFRHSKKINILIYSLTLVIAAGIPLYFLLRHIDIHIGFIILCFILNLTVVMCCLMLFIPPVLPVVKEKMGLKQDASFHRELHRKLSTKISISSLFTNDLYVTKLKD